MKKVKATLILLALGFVLSIGMMAQPPIPPTDMDSGGNQSPGGGPTGAPIEPGTGILLILAAAYGLYKIQEQRIKRANA
jgi:hypothetical protein